ncbi:MAG: hypothetical protein LQ351_007409 [Letrouitia transgressa]|nr:MAG: hypothetical protein LQ351_007409 [Letrouitia transgressa]
MAPNDLSVMLLNMNLNLIIVGLGEVNGTVIDGAARPADADRRSQKTMYNNLKGITAALPGTGTDKFWLRQCVEKLSAGKRKTTLENGEKTKGMKDGIMTYDVMRPKMIYGAFLIWY